MSDGKQLNLFEQGKKTVLSKLNQVGTLIDILNAVKDGTIDEQEANDIATKLYPDLPKNWTVTAELPELEDCIEKGYKAYKGVPAIIEFFESLHKLST